MRSVETIPPVRKKNGSFAFDNTEKGLVFTDLFQSAYEFDNSPEPVNNIQLQEINFEISFPPFVVHDYLAKLPGKFTKTTEDINQFVLKNCAASIASPLSLLFTEIYNSNIIPSQWKEAFIIPVFKKGDRHDANNYRPISITSAICRLFEKLIAVKIRRTYFHRIIPNQFGFLPKSSCCSALLSTVAQWEISLKNKSPVDVVYFDFRKAFDKCSHPKLLAKLGAFGLDKKLISFLSHFLTGRESHVRIENKTCPLPVKVHSGVLQGTVTGPLLFLIYINDISEVIASYPSIDYALYADDLKIFGSDHIQLQNCINAVSEWSVRWRLPLATDKLMVLHLGINNPRNQYHIENSPIIPQSVVRDLGLYIDERLSWDNHINRQIAKAHSICKIILNCFHFPSHEKYFSLFMTYALPLLEYCCELYSPRFSSPLCKSLESPLRQFSATVFQRLGMPYTSYLNRLNTANVKPLFYRRYCLDLMQTFKIIHDYTKIENFQFQMSRSPRCPNRIIVSSCRFKNDNFFFNRVVAQWNKIALNVRDIHNVDSFRAYLKTSNLMNQSDFPRFMMS
jgi:hypothetical protein